MRDLVQYCILLTMENTSVFLKFGLVSFNFIRLWCSLKFFYSSEEKVTLAYLKFITIQSHTKLLSVNASIHTEQQFHMTG